MTTLNDEINQHIADMNNKFNLAAGSLGPAAKPNYASQAAQSAPSVPTSAQPSRHNPNRLWLKGFGETLTTKFLIA
jgi:hypothetical protein